jgi:hypothetical protein
MAQHDDIMTITRGNGGIRDFMKIYIYGDLLY